MVLPRDMKTWAGTRRPRTRKPTTDIPHEYNEVAKFIRLCRTNKVRAIKMHGSDLQYGEPDVIGCLYGLFFAIEFKRQSDYDPSATQSATMADWKASGGITFTHWNAQQAWDNLMTIWRRMNT